MACQAVGVLNYSVYFDVGHGYQACREFAQAEQLAVVDVMGPSLKIGPLEFVWLVVHSLFIVLWLAAIGTHRKRR